jgi:hypothetical protein
LESRTGQRSRQPNINTPTLCFAQTPVPGHTSMALPKKPWNAILRRHSESHSACPLSVLLPMEVWGSIFRHVERNDLSTLARVSRLFRQEAEYVLYHDVDLSPTTNGARLASWCMSIIGDRRRASRVHTLRFPEYFKPPRRIFADSSAEIRQLIAQAFKAVVNLKRLFMYPTVDKSKVPTIVLSTFDNCTFRLTCVFGHFPGLTADEMWEFLSKQPDIFFWGPSSRFISSIDAIPPNTLPSMHEAVLDFPQKLPLFYDLPMWALKLEFNGTHAKYDGLAVINSLGLFEETLRCLSYVVTGSLTDWTTLDIIRSLANNAPNLEWLQIHSRQKVGFRDLPRQFIDSLPPGTRSEHTTKKTLSKQLVVSNTCVMSPSPSAWALSAIPRPIPPILRIHSNMTRSGHPNIRRRNVGKRRICSWHHVRPFGVYRFRLRVGEGSGSICVIMIAGLGLGWMDLMMSRGCGEMRTLPPFLLFIVSICCLCCLALLRVVAQFS